MAAPRGPSAPRWPSTTWARDRQHLGRLRRGRGLRGLRGRARDGRARARRVRLHRRRRVRRRASAAAGASRCSCTDRDVGRSRAARRPRRARARGRRAPAAPRASPWWSPARAVGNRDLRDGVGEPSRTRRARSRHRAAHPARTHGAGRRRVCRARSTIDCDGASCGVLFVVAATAPRMIIFGAVDFSAALAERRSLLGYRVTVCDARPLFATAAALSRRPTRSSSRGRPTTSRTTEVDSRTVICVLTHDDKFDVPLLDARAAPRRWPSSGRWDRARRTSVGSRPSRARARATPRSARLHSPIGLDLGGSTPAGDRGIDSRRGDRESHRLGRACRCARGPRPIHRTASTRTESPRTASTEAARP